MHGCASWKSYLEQSDLFCLWLWFGKIQGSSFYIKFCGYWRSHQKCIDVTEFSTSELFICATHCHKWLFRFQKLSNNFLSLKEEKLNRLLKRRLTTENLRKDLAAGGVAPPRYRSNQTALYKNHVLNPTGIPMFGAAQCSEISNFFCPSQPTFSSPINYPATYTSLYG